MTYIYSGTFSPHLTKQAVNSRTLGSLGREEDELLQKKGRLPSINQIPKRYVSQTSGRVFDKLSVKTSKKALSEQTPDEILKGLDIKVWQSSDGSRLLSKYEIPFEKAYTLHRAVDENDLIENVTTIFGTLNLRNSYLESTGSIKTVQDGIVIGRESKIKDLSSLQKVYGAVIIEANSDKEAVELLKKLNFHPKVFSGKIITIPPFDLFED